MNNSSIKYLDIWKEIIESNNISDSVKKYLGSFLTQSDECKALLDKIMNNFLEAKINNSNLELVFSTQYKKDCIIELNPPYFWEKKDFPNSFMEVAKNHNWISWKSFWWGYYGFWWFYKEEDDDKEVFNWSWFENDCLEEWDNEEFLEALENKDLSVYDIVSPMDYWQNWIIWNPLKKNKKWEPQLCFVSHEDCEVSTIKKANDLFFWPFLLRVMYIFIVDNKSEVLDEVYS